MSNKETNYIFTVDWFSCYIHNWTYFLQELKDKPNLRFLEIGSYQGRSNGMVIRKYINR